MEYIAIFNSNPTEGRLDGAEVSEEGIFSNPISANPTVDGFTKVKCAVRCATGYTANLVYLTVKTRQSGGMVTGNDYVSISATENGNYDESLTLSNVNATNKVFWARLAGTGEAGNYNNAVIQLETDVEPE